MYDYFEIFLGRMMDALQKISRDSGDDSKADIRNPLRYLLMNAVASRSAFKLTVNGRKVL